MMKALCTSEMSVSFNMATWRYIPEKSKLHVEKDVSGTAECRSVVLWLVDEGERSGGRGKGAFSVA
jgi:hypothetical protein